MEFFIARKVRPVFEVYRQVFHKVAKHELSRKELALRIKLEFPLLFIHSFGLKALPTERGKVKPVDCHKKQWQEEAGIKSCL